VRLLERDHPIEVLQTRAERAAAGHGGLVLLVGEAGIGKTALLRAFVERVSMPVLWGMCDPLSTPRPLGPLRDVAGALGSAVTASLRDSAAQHEIFAAVLDALRATPRVLVVEDLHWADEATTDLIRFVARRIDALPLLMIVSCRDTIATDSVLSPVVGDLVSTPGARRMQLTPLSRAAVAELLDGHLLDPADVHRRTAGNPFFVSQILDQPDAPLPESVRDAVIARTAGLTAEERHSIELLACAPNGVSSALLTALGLSAATVGALAATGLLDPSRPGWRSATRSPGRLCWVRSRSVPSRRCTPR
jgi:predicted ATPase